MDTTYHLTHAQEVSLRRLCERYKVPFESYHYRPTFDLQTGWVAGWIGGSDNAGHFNEHGERVLGGTLYVGCDPEGNVSS